MGIIHTILLGIVEGLTEFIPVSSTAHILIAGKVLGVRDSTFLEALSISIQSGAILAAVCYFWGTIWNHLSLIPKIIVAFIPTGIAGILLYPLVKAALGSTTVIALALIIGGTMMLFLRTNDNEASVTTITYKQAFIIGLVQIFSFIPGVSRAGSTLIGGTLMHIPRSVIVPFSFLLGIPTILGASVVEIRHVSGLSHSEWGLIGLGAIVAFATALLTIKFFINLLTKKPLSWFGWYRIIVGILVLVLI